MTIKIGDKVRFLNDVGGGIVSGFKNRDIVLVEDEDGFEIPVLITECVVIESSGGAGITIPQKAQIVEQYISETVTEFCNKKDFKTYLAIAPEFEDAPLQGKLEMYLVNDSNYFLYYLCEENSSNGKVMADGLLHPNTHQPIGTYTAQQLGELGKLKVRLLPFQRGKEYKHLSNVEKVVAFNAVKLAQSKSYEENQFFSFKTHLIAIHKDDLEESLNELASKEEQGKPTKSRLKSPKQTSEIIEVDLHIEALLDNFSGMSNGEMLEYQLNKFHDTLKENKGKKGQRIVFIHGVGNGRLKNDIRNSLKRKYQLEFQDASFREYGYGATMVIVR